MSRNKVIPTLMRSMKKTSINASVSEDALGKLIRIHEKMSYLNQSQLIEYCISTVHDIGMFGTESERIAAMKRLAAEFPVYIFPEKQKNKEPSEPQGETKEQMVARFGGDIDENNIVRFLKYEVTAMGEVVRMERSMPLRQIPDTENEIRRFMIGPFATVGEAEVKFLEK